MGEKISTIVLKVDLECERCYKKIRRAICKIQEKMSIKTISFDEKSNSVTISGPFDAEKVCKKLCCHACRVIKEMDIRGEESKNGAGGGDTVVPKPVVNEAPTTTVPVPRADIEPLLRKVREVLAASRRQQPNAAEAGEKVKADIGALIKKIKPDKVAGSEPVALQVAQGVAAPAVSLAGYCYNPSYYGDSYGGGCGCGYAGGYCRCGEPAAFSGVYYGVPVYGDQGWYYGGGQPNYPQ